MFISTSWILTLYFLFEFEWQFHVNKSNKENRATWQSSSSNWLQKFQDLSFQFTRQLYAQLYNRISFDKYYLRRRSERVKKLTGSLHLTTVLIFKAKQHWNKLKKSRSLVNLDWWIGVWTGFVINGSLERAHHFGSAWDAP